MSEKKINNHKLSGNDVTGDMKSNIHANKWAHISVAEGK